MIWLILLLSLYILLLLFIYAGYFIRNRLYTLPEPLPFVSVLVAARNEEQNIVRCISALQALNYPADKYEILIGDDASTDRSCQLAMELAARDSRIRIVSISEQWGLAKGKANVLAQLARQAQGSFLFITDADIAVNKDWIQTMLQHFGPNTGIVSGFTIVKQDSFFTKLQSLDWLYYMGLLASFNRSKIDATAVGNNMAIRKEAYHATGGYENIAFSVTEDLQLFKAVKALGWENVNSDHPGTLAWSQPISSFKKYLHQRKRWIQGGMGLPFYWKLILASLAALYPLLISLAFFNMELAFLFWVLKIILQSIISVSYNHRLGRAIRTNPLELLIFEFYIIWSTYTTGFFFLLPVRMDWKGRKY